MMCYQVHSVSRLWRQGLGHWPPPHTFKCPENAVSEETNLLASYVVTKSAETNTPSPAGGVVAGEEGVEGSPRDRSAWRQPSSVSGPIWAMHHRTNLALARHNGRTQTGWPLQAPID